MVTSSATVQATGPLFDGRFEPVVHAFLVEATEAAADEGVNLLHQAAGVFRNPTGHWESRLLTERRSDDRIIVDDVPYNAWLEGVSSRNRSSRFKGYRVWRLTAQKLQRDAGGIALRVMQRYIGRLN